jgi:hypothetical protein
MGSPLVNGSVIRRSLSLWLMMILPFVVGCDKVPTWQEMTDPQQQQPAAQPSATTTTFAPPPTIPIPAAAVQPSKPNSAQIIAGFNSLNSTEINDHTLAEVGALTEGLETIHKIDASRSHVSDAGLAHLSRLPGLLRLDLGGTRVTSQGMQHVAKVTTLESLSLSRTSVSDAGFVSLGSLSRLTVLDLRYCMLSLNACATIGNLPLLEELNLDSASGINDAALNLICNAGTLKRISMNYVGGISDKGLKALTKLDVLEELALAESNITGEGLANSTKLGLKNLKKLVLNKCPISEKGAKAINQCKSLEYLNVGSIAMDDAGFRLLTKGLTNLKHLHINNCQNLTGSGFNVLTGSPKLEILYLQQCGIVDKSLPLLKGQKNIIKLDLLRTRVTAPAVVELKKFLPDCEILAAWGH